jgi:hypothetical protein
VGPSDQLRPEWVLGIVLFVIALVLAIAIVAIVLTNISRGALIGMVGQVEETGETSVRSGWRIGSSRFWSLLGIDLVTVIPIIIAAIALIIVALLPLVLGLGQRESLTALGILLTVLLMLGVVGLLIVAGVVLGILREFAYRQCVLEGKGALDSIRGGYRMARQNLRHVGVVWLLLVGIDLAVGIVAIPLALVVFGLAAAPAAAIYAASKAIGPALVAGILIAIPGALLLALLGGVHLVFRSTTWTLAYRELQARSSLA